MPPKKEISRRKFVAQSIATTAFLVLHDQIMFANALNAASIHDQKGSRIKSLKIATKVPIKEMKDYYGNTLGLDVELTGNILTVIAGETNLIFEGAKDVKGEPWYHIAFNIPENKLWKAREWQLKKGPLKIRQPGPNVDAKYPDVIHYPKWDAHSIFFWDPAGNLLEYIARHSLNNASDGAFTSEDILCISEACFMSENVEHTSKDMKSKLNLNDYLHNNDHFYPIGDENGLLINFPIGRQWRSNNAGDRKMTDVYPTEVILRGERKLKYKHIKYPFSITVV